MSNNLFAGNNGVYCRVAITFAPAGLTAANCLVVFMIDNPNQSWSPAPGSLNTISGFEEGKFYYVIMKNGAAPLDLSANLVPPLPGSSQAPTTAYQFNDASQVISVASAGTDFNNPISQPFTVGFFGNVLAAGGVMRLGFSNGSARIWDINVAEAGGVVVPNLVFTEPSSAEHDTIATVGSSLNAFHYFVITWDGTNGKIYVDGALVAVTESGPVTSIATSGVFKIGQIGTYTSSQSQMKKLFFAGLAINASQQTALYNSGNPDVTAQSWYAASVVSYWPLASTLTDSKGTHSGTAATPVYV